MGTFSFHFYDWFNGKETSNFPDLQQSSWLFCRTLCVNMTLITRTCSDIYRKYISNSRSKPSSIKIRKCVFLKTSKSLLMILNNFLCTAWSYSLLIFYSTLHFLSSLSGINSLYFQHSIDSGCKMTATIFHYCVTVSPL